MGTNTFFRHAVTAIAAIAILAFAARLPVRADGPQPPEVRIDTVTDLGPLTPPQKIEGRDGGYSARFGGTSVWVYGDTLIRGEKHHTHALIPNSWSWTEDLHAADGIDGMTDARGRTKAPLPLFPFTDGERDYNRSHQPARCAQKPCGTRWALWPGALVADPARDRLLAFYEKVLVGASPLDFRIAGHAIAVWTDIRNPASRPVHRSGGKEPTLMFFEGEPGFGSGAVAVHGSLFVFGCDREGIRKPCRLARTPMETALDRKTWRFYSDKAAWTTDIKKSSPVFCGNDILSVSFNRYLRRFLAVYARPMSRSVMVRTAPAPQGPWSLPARAFEAKKPVSETGWIYDAMEHPEYATDGGQTIFVTYSRQIGPERFELRLVSVGFKRIALPEPSN